MLVRTVLPARQCDASQQVQGSSRRRSRLCTLYPPWSAWDPPVVCREMADAMQQSSKYSWAYSIGFLYSYVLTMPHSVAVNLAYPDEIAVNDNVFGSVLRASP